jgi:mannitol-1-phosphate 5-dehydrogenase
MVPLTDNKAESNLLDISAEAYNTLIVNKEAFKNPVPEVAGLEAKTNIKAWVDRKLFIHNFGHAATAYIGYQAHPESTYLWEVLEDKSVRLFIEETMRQSAATLQYIHPATFTEIQLQEHIDDLLGRFTNRSLGDTIFRVGCDLYRKLSPDDRIILPLKTAFHAGLPFDKISKVLAAALCFSAVGPDKQLFTSDIKFHKELKTKGKKHILQNICRIDKNEKALLNQIIQI